MDAKTDLAIAIAILLIVALVASVEVGYVSGGYAALLAGACLISSLVFSFAKGIPKTEAVMQKDGEDSLTLKGFGAEADLRGPNIVARTLGSNTMTNILLFGIAAGLYLHDGATTEAQKRLAAAVEVSNYIGLQPEEKRLEIGKRMAEPEALRRLYR